MAGINIYRMAIIPNVYHQQMPSEFYDSKSQQSKIPGLVTSEAQLVYKTLQMPLSYVIDYFRKKYLYIDPSFDVMFGFENEFFNRAGPGYFTYLCHKNDLRIINEFIFPEVIRFLGKFEVPDYSKFSFSFNYRIRNVEGHYISLLQKTRFYAATRYGKPIAAAGYVVDISHYKEDSRIVHIVEQAENNVTHTYAPPLFKSTYYPDKFDSVLSNRELEILDGINKGLSSKEISVQYSLSINTINNHRKNMLRKTSSGNSSELIAYARRNGLL